MKQPGELRRGRLQRQFDKSEGGIEGRVEWDRPEGREAYAGEPQLPCPDSHGLDQRPADASATMVRVHRQFAQMQEAADLTHCGKAGRRAIRRHDDEDIVRLCPAGESLRVGRRLRRQSRIAVVGEALRGPVLQEDKRRVVGCDAGAQAIAGRKGRQPS